MKQLALLILLIATAAAQTQDLHVYWGESVDGLSLGLAVSNAPYALDKPVLVHVHLRNDTRVDKQLLVGPLPRTIFSFVATDSSRKFVEAKPVEGYDGSVAGRLLSPGQIKTEIVDLRDYLYLTNGNFVLTAKRLLYWPTHALSGNAIIEVVSTNQSTPATIVTQHSVTSMTLLAKTNAADENNSTIASAMSRSAPLPSAVMSGSTERVLKSVPESQTTNQGKMTRFEKTATGTIIVLLALVLFIFLRAKGRR